MWKLAQARCIRKHFCGCSDPGAYRVAYVQPSRRPADGRYGENPNRLYKHSQLQVILKPSPADVQDLYLKSLAAIGLNLTEHDVRFEEDNWESPTLGAWGMGWQVLLDGLGDYAVHLLPAERRNRPRPRLRGIDLWPGPDLRLSCKAWTASTTFAGRTIVLRRRFGCSKSRQFSAYNFEYAIRSITRKLFELHEKEAGATARWL